jgi:ascorbate-specific PTS system EIIC-type component UlaA
VCLNVPSLCLTVLNRVTTAKTIMFGGFYSILACIFVVSHVINYHREIYTVVLICSLICILCLEISHLQLPMQSVPITTEVYSIQHYVIVTI